MSVGRSSITIPLMFAGQLGFHCSVILLLGMCFLVRGHGQNQEILGEYRIGLLGLDRNNAAYEASHSGARLAATEFEEKYSVRVDLEIRTPLLDKGESQTQSLVDLFIGSIDGVIISPQGDPGVVSALQLLRRQGGQVIFFESHVAGVEVLATLVADEFEAGRLASEKILPLLPTGGRVALLTSENPTPADKERLRGAKAALGYRRIERIVACAPEYFSAIDALHAAEEADRNDQIKAWIFLGDWPLLGLPALPWDPGKLPIVAIQSSPSAFLYIDQRYVDALIIHPYFEWGYESMVLMLEKLHLGKDPDTALVQKEPLIVDFKNVDAYKARWKAWNHN